METRYICFDMDGVIVDSEPAHYEAFRQTLGMDGFDLWHDD